MAEQTKQEMLSYKGRPLVRSGKTLYYGDPGEAYVAVLNIMATEKDDAGDEFATKVIIQHMATDASLSPKDRILKRAERDGLFSALQLAAIWLGRDDSKNDGDKASHSKKAPR